MTTEQGAAHDVSWWRSAGLNALTRDSKVHRTVDGVNTLCGHRIPRPGKAHKGFPNPNDPRCVRCAAKETRSGG
jgi:hypothetical protein